MKTLQCALIAFFCIINSTSAQTKNSTISGTVITADGKPAASVTITLKNSTKGAVSGADGSYEIRKIEQGDHTLQISLIGYNNIEHKVTLSAGEHAEINFKLALSASELNEVVVRSGKNNYNTAVVSPTLRVQQVILKLPQHIQVATENILRDQQLFDMSEGVTRNVSGSTYSAAESWGNYSNIMMRGGVVTPARNGFNIKMPWGPLLEDMSMVEKIEFVKGPAGFMFSNAEPTGLYNIVTKKPTGVAKGEATFALGSFDTYRTTLDLDGKLSSDRKLLYRFNFMGQLKNSHRDFEYNNRISIAPVVTYQINNQTSLTAEYTYQHMKMAMLGSSYLFSVRMGDLPGNLSTLETNLEPSKMREHNLSVALHHNISSEWKLTAQFNYLDYLQVGSSMWPSYPNGLTEEGILTRSIANWDAAGHARLGQLFINGQFKTGRIQHKILGGVDLTYKNYYADFYQAFNITGYDYFANSVPFNIYNPVHGIVPADHLPKFDRSLPLKQRGGGTMGESSGSLYVQDEVSLIRDMVRFTIAGRITKLKQHSFGAYSNDKEITPRAGINVSLNKSASVYLLYDKNFIAQQGVDSAGSPFVPGTGINIEGGIKKVWARGWSSTLSLFRITRNNLITYIPAPEFTPVQTGQTRTDGIELDVNGEIIRSLNLIMNYSYNKAEITKDEDPAKVGGPLQGPRFPEHIANAWLTYRFNIQEIKGFGTSLGYQYMKGRGYDLPEYFKLDAGLFWQKDRFRIFLNANNLLNRYLYNGSPYEYNNNPASSEYYFIVEPGIHFRLGVGVSW